MASAIIVMGTSIQLVGTQSVRLNDIDLLILMGLMVEEVGANPESYPRLSRFSSYWAQGREAYGPGTLDLDLHNLVKDEGARDQFAHLLRSVRAKHLSKSAVLEAGFLNAKFNVNGVKFFDCDTGRLLFVAEKLHALLP